jgi:hypothetical protein
MIIKIIKNFINKKRAKKILKKIKKERKWVY